MIRRRHVFYVEGYDPQGAAGYYGMFGRELKRFRRAWGVRADLGELAIHEGPGRMLAARFNRPSWM